MPTLKERLAAKSHDLPNGCRVWDGYRLRDGYGRFRRGGHASPKILVHRAAYEAYIGPIPEGMQLDHLCRNRACINPAHLQVVTPRENWARGMNVTAMHARQTVCKRGHPLEGEHLDPHRLPHRVCKTCELELKREKWRSDPAFRASRREYMRACRVVR